MPGAGSQAGIVFDIGDPMGHSSCVGCGECVQACPTGALMPAGEVGLTEPDKTVDSVCPYCGVGCLLTYHVKDNRILYVTGRDGPANHGRAVRQRPLWLRLCEPPPAFDTTPDPQARRSQVGRGQL